MLFIAEVCESHICTKHVVKVMETFHDHKQIYGSSFNAWGGDNVLGYRAAVVLRASLQNERNGSLVLG